MAHFTTMKHENCTIEIANVEFWNTNELNYDDATAHVKKLGEGYRLASSEEIFENIESITGVLSDMGLCLGVGAWCCDEARSDDEELRFVVNLNCQNEYEEEAILFGKDYWWCYTIPVKVSVE